MYMENKIKCFLYWLMDLNNWIYTGALSSISLAVIGQLWLLLSNCQAKFVHDRHSLTKRTHLLVLHNTILGYRLEDNFQSASLVL